MKTSLEWISKNSGFIVIILCLLNLVCSIMIAIIVLLQVLGPSKSGVSADSLGNMLEIYKEWPNENQHYNDDCTSYNPGFYNRLFK